MPWPCLWYLGRPLVCGPALGSPPDTRDGGRFRGCCASRSLAAAGGVGLAITARAGAIGLLAFFLPEMC